MATLRRDRYSKILVTVMFLAFGLQGASCSWMVVTGIVWLSSVVVPSSVSLGSWMLAHPGWLFGSGAWAWVGLTASIFLYPLLSVLVWRAYGPEDIKEMLKSRDEDILLAITNVGLLQVLPLIAEVEAMREIRRTTFSVVDPTVPRYDPRGDW